MPAEYDGLTVEWIGHAATRIESNDGVVIYLDPWCGVLDERRDDADYVFVSHGDGDHFDPFAIDAVATAETTIVPYAPLDVADFWAPYFIDSEERPIRPLAYDATRTFDEDELRFEAVPAYNRADGDHVDENGEPNHAHGEVIGVIITIAGVSTYYPADTDFLDVHRDIDADVFLPPIGGRATMDRHQAADFVESVDPAVVLPVHYNTGLIWGIDTDPEAFKRDVESRGYNVVLS